MSEETAAIALVPKVPTDLNEQLDAIHDDLADLSSSHIRLARICRDTLQQGTDNRYALRALDRKFDSFASKAADDKWKTKLEFKISEIALGQVAMQEQLREHKKMIARLISLFESQE
jgi:hypothetical protein